jgi:hypothetical protein
VLLKPLGFRAGPGLSAPHVIPTLNYLQPPTRVRVVGATGPLWTPNVFCQVEYGGRSGYLRCDDANAYRIVTSTSAASASDGGACMANARTIPDVGLKLCTDPASCKAFCNCACTFDPRAWQDADCQGAPQTGAGMIGPDSSDLKPLPQFSNVAGLRGVKATQAVIDGLTALDTYAGTASWRTEFRVQVNNCYRPHINDTERECGYIMKAQHILNKYASVAPANAKEREQLRWAQNEGQDPVRLGLSYPGATPHSAGNACDIVMIDLATKAPAFTCAAEDTARAKLASRALDEAITAAGGRRLNYEAWHYEWGGTTKSRCAYPDCDKFWPPTCKP